MAKRGEPGVLAEQFDVFLFDLDGVIYLGREPLPGAQETLSWLRSGGKTIRFLTNDPRPTRTQVARRLAGLGVEARAEEVVTSGWATARYLREKGVGTAYVFRACVRCTGRRRRTRDRRPCGTLCGECG